MSTAMNIDMKLHEARSEQIKGNYSESLSLYVSVMDMLEIAMGNCTPQEKEYYTNMMNNTVAEYEMVSNQASHQTSFPKRAPSIPAFPYANVPVIYGYVPVPPPVGMSVVRSFPVASAYTAPNASQVATNVTQPQNIPQSSAPQSSTPQPSIPEPSTPQPLGASQPSTPQPSAPQLQGTLQTGVPQTQGASQPSDANAPYDPQSPQLAVESINLPPENKKTSCTRKRDNFFIRIQKKTAEWLKRTPWANKIAKGTEKAATVLATGIVVVLAEIVKAWKKLLSGKNKVSNTKVTVSAATTPSTSATESSALHEDHPSGVFPTLP